MSNVKEPMVSCLCVTEERPAFMPWLLWCFERQTWQHRELVIVDSSIQPLQIVERKEIRIIRVSPGLNVAKKRNIVLREAHGEIITWFDDDDWQHPDKLSLLVKALNGDAVYAGSSKAWFVDIIGKRCASYNCSNWHILFNSAGFRRNAVLPIHFQENVRQASDTRWMNNLNTQYRTRAVVMDPNVPMFLWLCHGNNLSNPARKKNFSQPLEVVKKLVGSKAWGNTDYELDALKMRLENNNQSCRVNFGLQTKSEVSMLNKANSVIMNDTIHIKKNTNVKKESPPVGLFIKATVMDVPFLDIMVRHMISQARYPFVEKTIVIDRRPAFTGKYRVRSKSSHDELNMILDRLLKDRIVDHVREVDMSKAQVVKVMERYFSKDAHHVPTHAATGGPIYTTLFGLESMSTDYVLQMDADIFFYSSSVSWVSQAIKCMDRDPKLWLMMAHPGPPSGKAGRSLGVRNRRCATWDQELSIWRFTSATTRYFLCDRRKLHGRLRSISQRGGCAPLEQLISDALKRFGSFRGALGNLESWHLHAWYHGDPFPQWAPTLAKVIKNGDYPAMQQGEYDMRLDKARDRREWWKVLQSMKSDKKTIAELGTNDTQPSLTKNLYRQESLLSGVPNNNNDESQRKTESCDHSIVVKQTKVINKPLSLAIIISVRDRAGQRFQNMLRSLNWQSAGKAKQILVVSHGSKHEINRELSGICSEESARLITIGEPKEPWNKPLALNIGIRATLPEVSFIMTMDIDMILSPNFFEVVLNRLKSEPPALVLCRSYDLPQYISLPNKSEKLLDTFDNLKTKSRLRNQSGTGGIQAALRSFFFDVNGYDEDLLWWGAMDGDIVQRALLSGLAIEWIEDRAAMLHQWHPRKQALLKNRKDIEQAKRAWISNHKLMWERSKTIQRNPNGWGNCKLDFIAKQLQGLHIWMKQLSIY